MEKCLKMWKNVFYIKKKTHKNSTVAAFTLCVCILHINYVSHFLYYIGSVGSFLILKYILWSGQKHIKETKMKRNALKENVDCDWQQLPTLWWVAPHGIFCYWPKTSFAIFLLLITILFEIKKKFGFRLVQKWSILCKSVKSFRVTWKSEMGMKEVGWSWTAQCNITLLIS